jgi:hypothetical protein
MPLGQLQFRTNPNLWILEGVVRTPLTGDQSIAAALPEQDDTNTQGMRTYTLIPVVRFELKIPLFEEPYRPV